MVSKEMFIWLYLIQFSHTGANPALVVGGGAKSLDGAPTQYIYRFSEKPHEIKEILVHRGTRAGSAPPPKSAPEVAIFMGVRCLEKCSLGCT